MTPADRRAIVADGLMTVEEVCAFTTLAESTVYSLLADKRLAGVRIGRAIRVPRKALVQFLADRVDA